MWNLKKICTILAISFFIFSVGTLVAQGQILKSDKQKDLQNNVNAISSQSGYSQADTLEVIIARIIRIVLAALGTVFMIYLFLAGQAWMRAGGNAQIVAESQEKIKSLLIGLFIVLGAYALSSWISKVLANLIQ
ncbi:MAG: hypothetical protein ACOX0H_03820 [Patescibacteria group bacterium]|jgi:small-conductance mechanosensitive channel|nr:hypothetical protein [bacterium]HQC49928.1 hypothetical protein [bacterium]